MEYYKGYSLNPHKRLDEHNNQESRYTKHFIPWVLIFVQCFDNKREALKREKALKMYSKSYFILVRSVTY